MNQMIAYGGEICKGMCFGDVDYSFMGWMMATFGVFFLLLVALALVVLGFWIWMLVDALKRGDDSYQRIGSGDKSLWIIILIVSFLFQVTLIGSLIYFFLIYQKDKVAKKAPKKK